MAANPKRARLFHDKSFQDNEDVYRPFLRFDFFLFTFPGILSRLSAMLGRVYQTMDLQGTIFSSDNWTAFVLNVEPKECLK